MASIGSLGWLVPSASVFVTVIRYVVFGASGLMMADDPEPLTVAVRTGALEPTGVAVTVEEVITPAVSPAGVHDTWKRSWSVSPTSMFDCDALTALGGAGATRGGLVVSRYAAVAVL